MPTFLAVAVPNIPKTFRRIDPEDDMERYVSPNRITKLSYLSRPLVGGPPMERVIEVPPGSSVTVSPIEIDFRDPKTVFGIL